MIINKVNVRDFINDSKKKLASGSDLKEALELSLTLLKLFCDRLAKDSRNSSRPPSSDPHRDKNRKGKMPGEQKKPGGQPGHDGTTLKRTENPDEVIELEVDKESLPRGRYRQVGFDSAQVYDVEISTRITEYRAEILEDEFGNRYVANFPWGVKNTVQYGPRVKSLSVYLSIFQLIPLERIRDFFNDQLNLPLSKGSVSNFNEECLRRLEEIGFLDWAKKQLLSSPLLHADESGINVGGKGHWLHTLSNGLVTLYGADQKRGKDAMDRMDVLPHYKGILCHDHWKPYYSYACIHALCNAHHQRELEFAHEQDNQKWAKLIQDLLEEIRKKVEDSGNFCLCPKDAEEYEKNYCEILESGKEECPIPPRPKKKKGRQKKSKSRNLLERLLDYRQDTLRFMVNPNVPYTNNFAEGEIRFVKLYQNISKCFRTLQGAKRFSIIRSFFITARSHGMTASEAALCLVLGEVPFFMRE